MKNIRIRSANRRPSPSDAKVEAIRKQIAQDLAFRKAYPYTFQLIPFNIHVSGAPRELLEAIAGLESEPYTTVVHKLSKLGVTKDEAIATTWKCLQPRDGLGDRTSRIKEALEWHSNQKNRRRLEDTVRKILPDLEKVHNSIWHMVTNPRLGPEILALTSSRLYEMITIGIPALRGFLKCRPMFPKIHKPKDGPKENMGINLAMIELRNLFCRKTGSSQNTKGAELIVDILDCFGHRKQTTNVIRHLKIHPYSLPTSSNPMK